MPGWSPVMKINIPGYSSTYPIVFDQKFSFHLNQLNPKPNKVFYLFDQNTQKLTDILDTDTNYFHAMPVGEKNKTMDTVCQIHEQLLKNNFSRNDLLICVGGGIVSDVGGFAASTFLRGMRFINFPTSLLAMVDATIGGKTGVNASTGKNLIGSFHHPTLVYINPTVLKTLPDEEMVNGLAEMVKHGLICDPLHYEEVISHHSKILAKDPVFLKSVIEKSLSIKKTIVEEDPHEKGVRKFLNLGHTLGHAIEKATNYQVSHGRAVLIGIILECFLASKLELLPTAIYDEIVNSLKKNIINHTEWLFLKDENFLRDLTPLNLLPFMLSDKKNQDQKIGFSLLKNIGETSFHLYPVAEIESLLAKLPSLKQMLELS